MKQHITIDQLKELSEKGKERYYGWVDNHVEIGRPRDIFLSIGQMIEFIKESGGSMSITLWDEGWTVTWNNNKGLVEPMFYDELCDALWEAMKQVLESQQEIR